MSMARLAGFARSFSAALGTSLATGVAYGLAAGLALAASGCADAEETVIVTGAVPLDENCTTQGGLYLSRTTIDTSFGTGGVVALEIQNNQPQRGDSSTGIIDDAEIQLESARYTLYAFADDGTETEIGEFQQPIPTLSIAGGGGRGFVFIELTADQLAAGAGSLGPGGTATFVIDVEITALRAGSAGPGKVGRIDVRPFRFPITLCDGCLRQCLSTEDPSTDPPTELCTAEACSAPIVQTGGVCGLAQDTVINPPCCTGELADCPGA